MANVHKNPCRGQQQKQTHPNARTGTVAEVPCSDYTSPGLVGPHRCSLPHVPQSLLRPRQRPHHPSGQPRVAAGLSRSPAARGGL